MKVSNLLSPRTNTAVKNQFMIESDNAVAFQSYKSLICTIDYTNKEITIWRDWNYSSTTTKYFRIFLNNLYLYDLHKLIKKNNWNDFQYNDYSVYFRN